MCKLNQKDKYVSQNKDITPDDAAVSDEAQALITPGALSSDEAQPTSPLINNENVSSSSQQFVPVVEQLPVCRLDQKHKYVSQVKDITVDDTTLTIEQSALVNPQSQRASYAVDSTTQQPAFVRQASSSTTRSIIDYNRDGAIEQQAPVIQRVTSTSVVSKSHNKPANSKATSSLLVPTVDDEVDRLVNPRSDIDALTKPTVKRAAKANRLSYNPAANKTFFDFARDGVTTNNKPVLERTKSPSVSNQQSANSSATQLNIDDESERLTNPGAHKTTAAADSAELSRHHKQHSISMHQQSQQCSVIDFNRDGVQTVLASDHQDKPTDNKSNKPRPLRRSNTHHSVDMTQARSIINEPSSFTRQNSTVMSSDTGIDANASSPATKARLSLFRQASRRVIKNAPQKISVTQLSATELEDEIAALSNPKGSSSLMQPGSHKHTPSVLPKQSSLDITANNKAAAGALKRIGNEVRERNSGTKSNSAGLFPVVQNAVASHRNKNGANNSAMFNDDDLLDEELALTYPGYNNLKLENPTEAKRLKQELIEQRNNSDDTHNNVVA